MRTVEAVRSKGTPAAWNRGASLIDLALSPLNAINPMLLACRALARAWYPAGATSTHEDGRPIAPHVRIFAGGDRHTAKAEALKYALNLAPKFEAAERYAKALATIDAALAEAVTAPQAQAMIAGMLDGFGRKQVGNPEAFIEAMVASVFDAASPVARELDLWPTVAEPVSPMVLAAALKTLRNSKVFTPEPAELREAIIEADDKIRRGRLTIQSFDRAREDNNKFIAEIEASILSDEEHRLAIENRRA